MDQNTNYLAHLCSFDQQQNYKKPSMFHRQIKPTILQKTTMQLSEYLF